MTEETNNVTQHPKQNKSPVDNAATKIKEAASKAAQAKVDEQTKKTLDALKVFQAEKAKLQSIVQEYEQEKLELSELLGSLN